LQRDQAGIIGCHENAIAENSHTTALARRCVVYYCSAV
jgi:hypothetical protein